MNALLDDLRTVFAGRRDQWLNESGQTMSEFPHFLPGVDARGIRDALKSKGAMPLQTELPGLEAAPEVVAAAPWSGSAAKGRSAQVVSPGVPDVLDPRNTCTPDKH